MRRRASQRTVISIDLSGKLRELMTEQCKSDCGGYITVYRGSRAELVAAGVPEAAFATEEGTPFQVQTLNVCCTGSRELLSGSICPMADGGFDLEIDWQHVRPYVQCSHPAIAELARMLLKDVLWWTHTDYGKGGMPNVDDLAHPIDTLADDERATDYKPRPGALRLQVTAEFNKRLHSYASYLYEAVYTDGEVLTSTDTAVKHPPHLRLAIDNTAVHS
jgi:hypothetical protein